MKSKEELAAEYATGEWFTTESGTPTKCIDNDLYDAFREGFDAGFQRAVEMLRIQSFRNNLTCHQWADWLEKENNK